MSHATRAPVSMRGVRGSTAVVALVLLIGLVAIGTAGVVVLTDQVITDTQRDAEVERVERAFVDMGHAIETAASADERSRAIDLSTGPGAGSIRTGANGHVTVRVGGVEYVNRTLGSVVYAATDGTEVAYQGGGVWRRTGGQTSLVSSPNVHYRDGTLALPLVTVGEDGSLSGARTIATTSPPVGYSGRTGVQPITIELTSRYHDGWHRYFESNVEGARVETVPATTSGTGRSVTPDTETVIVTVNGSSVGGPGGGGRPAGGGGGPVEAVGAIVAEGDVSLRGNVDVIGPVVAAGAIATRGNVCRPARSCDLHPNEPVDYDPIDDEIDTLVAGGAGSFESIGAYDDGSGTYHLDAGTYYLDELDVRGTDLVVLDVDAGDVVLVVDGDVEIGGGADLVVRNAASGHAARVYTTGDVTLRGNTDFCVEPCDGTTLDADALQVYATASSSVVLRGNVYVEAVVYAPSDGADGPGCRTCIDGAGNLEFYGAVIAGPTELAGNTYFEYDGSLGSFEVPLVPPSAGGGGGSGAGGGGGAGMGSNATTGVTYLHVTVHEVQFEASDE